MGILIVTQTVDVNDPILGFFVRWIAEFAKHCEYVHVLALNVGEHSLPENVFVHCLGKSEGKNKLVWLWRLWSLSVRLRRQYKTVFVHMNPEYVLYGFLIWKVWSKKITLWYAHGTVTTKLTLATRLCFKVFTSTEKGFRIESPKRCVVGQGIDVNRFVVSNHKQVESSLLRLTTVGRISSTKHIETLLGVCENLKNRGIPFTFEIIGTPLTLEDQKYLQKLKGLVTAKNIEKEVTFIGAVPNTDLPAYLQNYDIFIQDGQTGSLDKVLLESIACGLVTFSSNESYRVFVKDDLPHVVYEPYEILQLTNLVQRYINDRSPYQFATTSLRDTIVKKHSIESLIRNILIHV